MSGKSIFLVEDESLIGMMIEDMIEELDMTLHAQAFSVPEALEKCEGDFDGAILDVNLGDEEVWPVARRLRERGIPFLISSGASGASLPEEFANVPTIGKPYTFAGLESALGGLFSKD